MKEPAMTSASTFVREAAVAGQFYPGSAAELDATVRNFLDHAEAGQDPVPKAIIAPHAGYVYSGAVAATAYARLAPAAATIKRVVLLGPCHRVAVRGLALSGAGVFRTPLGDIPVDKDAGARILDLPEVQVFDPTHELEHSLEVHLPFLQSVLDDFTLVPLVVGEASPGTVADVLEALWGGPETLIVISTDLSHYLDYESAQALDGATCRAIETLDAGAISPDGACGRFPVGGLLEAAKRKGMTVATLDLRNSGDTAGPKDRVVGYGAWVFQEARTGEARTGTNKNQARTGEARTGTNKNQARSGDSRDRDQKQEARLDTNAEPSSETPSESLSETRALLGRHGADLLKLAAKSTRHGLENAKPLPVDIDICADELTQPGACFVTLKRDGILRGCIGTSEAHRALVLDVAENAFRAAFKDPRFPALTADELDGLELSISVLSPISPMTFSGEADFLGQLQPGIDGLIIEDKSHRAIFLPSVWAQLPDVKNFVEHLKAKAGLPKAHWSGNFKAWRFLAEEISAAGLDDPASIWSN